MRWKPDDLASKRALGTQISRLHSRSLDTVKRVEKLGRHRRGDVACAFEKQDTEPLNSDDVFQEASSLHRAVEPEQSLQRHSDAGLSWLSWPKASLKVNPVKATWWLGKVGFWRRLALPKCRERERERASQRERARARARG